MNKLYTDDRGAIDLPSVMVAVIIIGLLAILVGLKVIPLIPWAQDTAAKHSLSKAVDAQATARIFEGNYVSEERLVEMGLLKASDAEKIETIALRAPFDGINRSGSTAGNHFASFIISPTGKEFVAHDGDTNPGSLAPQPDAPGIMVTRWDTGIAGCETITIPMYGIDPGSSIDWGDGVQSTPGANTPSHTYSVAETVEVNFTGRFDTFSFWKANQESSRCLTAVGQWAGTGTTSLEGAFMSANNLEEVPQIPSGVTNIAHAFQNNEHFNGDISGWDTSSVTTMAQLFDNAFEFNQPINGWNTSKAEDMTAAFYGAYAFNQPLNSWNVSKVKNMHNMFGRAIAFNQDLNSWNTSGVTDMSGMFDYAMAFNGDISTWNTSKVEDMSIMFSSATSFNGNIGGWKVENVTYMDRMFDGASSFSQDLGNWDVANSGASSAIFDNSAMSGRTDLYPAAWR